MRSSRICFAVFFALAASLACQRSSQNVVEQMLEAARLGKDTSPFWMSGAPKQELFNVLHYEVMSERPLVEAIKPYLPALKLYHKSQIDNLQVQIEKSEKAKVQIEEIEKAKVQIEEIEKARGELEAKILTLNSIVALGPPPPDASLDQLKKWDDAVETLMPKHASCIPRCMHDVGHPKLDNALGDREVVDRGQLPPLGLEYFRSLLKKNTADAYTELTDEFKQFEDRLRRANDELADEFKQFEDRLRRANDVVSQAPAGIEALKNKKKAQEQTNAQIDAKLTACQGVAYKVRVDSTNKAGLEVHNLWTITVVQTTDKTWKVTYLFDEKDFAEANAPDKEIGLLAMIAIF